MGIVTYEDDNGIVFETEAFGLAPNEQREAVIDDLTIRSANQLVDDEIPQTPRFVYGGRE